MEAAHERGGNKLQRSTSSVSASAILLRYSEQPLARIVGKRDMHYTRLSNQLLNSRWTMRTLAAFLCLLPWLTLAQVPVMPGGAVPWFKLKSANPNELPQYTNVWVDLDDTDLSLGTASSWTDRVHGLVFTNSAKPATKNSTGLRFYGSNYYRFQGTGLPSGINSNDAFMVVVRQYFGTYGTVFGVLPSGSPWGFLMYNRKWRMTFQNSVENWASVVTSNVWTDVIYTGGTNKCCWTNGVFSKDLNGLVSAGSWGWGAIGNNQGSPNADGTDHWNGEIRKIVWWTNCAVSGGLSTSEVQTLHTWATNQFQYTP